MSLRMLQFVACVFWCGIMFVNTGCAVTYTSATTKCVKGSSGTGTCYRCAGMTYSNTGDCTAEIDQAGGCTNTTVQTKSTGTVLTGYIGSRSYLYFCASDGWHRCNGSTGTGWVDLADLGSTVAEIESYGAWSNACHVTFSQQNYGGNAGAKYKYRCRANTYPVARSGYSNSDLDSTDGSWLQSQNATSLSIGGVGNVPNYTCTSCPANSTSDAGAVLIDDCKCDSGYYKSGSACAACPSGTYLDYVWSGNESSGCVGKNFGPETLGAEPVSDTGSTSITSCYIRSTDWISYRASMITGSLSSIYYEDDKGRFTTSSDCYYSTSAANTYSNVCPAN